MNFDHDFSNFSKSSLSVEILLPGIIWRAIKGIYIWRVLMLIILLFNSLSYYCFVNFIFLINLNFNRVLLRSTTLRLWKWLSSLSNWSSILYRWICLLCLIACICFNWNAFDVVLHSCMYRSTYDEHLPADDMNAMRREVLNWSLGL